MFIPVMPNVLVFMATSHVCFVLICFESAQVEGLGEELLWAWRGLTPLTLALLHGRGDVALLLVRPK